MLCLSYMMFLDTWVIVLSIYKYFILLFIFLILLVYSLSFFKKTNSILCSITCWIRLSLFVQYFFFFQKKKNPVLFFPLVFSPFGIVLLWFYFKKIIKEKELQSCINLWSALLLRTNHLFIKNFKFDYALDS